MDAGGQDHGPRGQRVVSVDAEAVFGLFQRRGFRVAELHAQRRYLLLQLHREIGAADAGDGGIILHQRGVDDLAAGEFLFQQQDVLAGAGGVEGGGHAGGAGADDEDIVHNGNFLSLVVLFRKGRTLESARERGFVA